MSKNIITNFVIYGSSDFFLKLIAFFTFPIIASAMSVKEFGALELITSSIGFGSFFIRCGINNAVQRFYWDLEAENQGQQIITTALIILTCFGLSASALGIICIPFIMPLVQKASLPISQVALYSAAGLVFLLQIHKFILDTLRLHFVPWKFFCFSLLSGLFLSLTGLVAVVFLDKGVDGLLLFQLITALIILPIGLLWINKDLTLVFEIRWAKKLLVYGYPYIFVDLAYWIFGSTDRWMLAGMTNVEETGIYSVAAKFSTIVLFVSNAFGMAWSPYAIKLKTDKPEIYRKLYAEVLIILLFVLLVVGGGIALFSGEIIYLIMSSEYSKSAIPMTILCFGIVVQTTQQITAVGISIEKKTYLFAKLSWVVASINLVLNFLLIPRYGSDGAASATLISFITLTLLYLFHSQRLHPIPVNWGRLGWLVFLGACVFLFAIKMNEKTWDNQTVLIKLVIAFTALILAWPALRKSLIAFSKSPS